MSLHLLDLDAPDARANATPTAATVGSHRSSSRRSESSPERKLQQHSGHDPCGDAFVRLLESDNVDTVRSGVRRLVALAGPRASSVLARLLHHADGVVAAAAERALWRIWFMAGSRSARHRLRAAIALLQENRVCDALASLDAIITDEKDYAEAFNQRAIARCLNDDFIGAIADYRQTLLLNPTHFAAAAGIGHCFVCLGWHCEALDAYRAALAIHPRMDGVRQMIRQIRTLVTEPTPAPEPLAAALPI